MEHPHVERRLAAIFAADVAGYTRLTGADEEGTIARLKALRHELIDPAIARGRGRVFKTTGDGILIEFASAVEAVRCAIEVQRGAFQRNGGLAQDQRIEFRVGIHVGDVVVDGTDLLGDGVNVAARLEGISEIGGIFLSEDAWRQVRGKVAAEFADIGERSLKNVARPVRVYKIEANLASASVASGTLQALPDKASIAVLAFQNMSGDSEQEFFADGMVEDIITGLSKVKRFFVLARNSTFTYKGKAVNVKQVAHELGARYVLEGSVRKAGTRMRITAQLIDAASGNHIWAERYDRELADFFVVQDEITANVVASIEPQLYAAEELRARRKPPESLDAWGCVVRALALVNSRTQEDIARAVHLLRDAIVFDPTYGHAHSLLAYAIAMQALYGWEPRESALPAASEIASRALLLDADDPWAHFAVGNVLVNSLKVREGVAAYRAALSLNPNFAMVRGQLGGALAMLGESAESLAEIDLAERLSPRDLFAGVNNMCRSVAHFSAGNYQRGIKCARTSLQQSPNLLTAYRMLFYNSAMAGDMAEARSALENLRRLVPDFERARKEWSRYFVRMEDSQKSLEAFRRLGLE